MGKIIGDIREDHRNRYEQAKFYAKENKVKNVLDIGSGCGYGAYMLRNAVETIFTIEKDRDAVVHAMKYFDNKNISHSLGDFLNYFPKTAIEIDLLTAFEIIEHVESELIANYLLRISRSVKWLIGSVPNQIKVPFNKQLHHHHVRHYTPEEIVNFLSENGWQVTKIGRQVGKHGGAATVEWYQYSPNNKFAYHEVNEARTILFCAESSIQKYKEIVDKHVEGKQ